MSQVGDLTAKVSALLGGASAAPPPMQSAGASFKDAGSLEPQGKNQLAADRAQCRECL